MPRKTDAVVARTIGIDTGKNTLAVTASNSCSTSLLEPPSSG
jgi:hypothetical protein